MKDNFSLLGVGACGGNQVSAFKKYGVNSFYINSALEDLQSLGTDNIHYYHLEGANGCHKDRNVSKNYLAENYEDVLKNIERHLIGRYIFVFGSIGGGTFSGMCALLTELIEAELNKIVIPVVTMPNFSESLQAKTNAYEALRELIETAKHTIFIVDNNKELNYSKSNEILAEVVYSLVSDVSTSIDGIYDYSEICSMLECSGYGILNTFSRKPNQSDITADLKKAVTDNIFCDIESRNPLYYCGIKSSNTRKTISINTTELQLQFGYWRDLFVGYQTKTNLIFMSGLQYPATTINKLYESIQDDKKKIEEDLKSTQTQTLFKDDYSISISGSIPEKKPLSARERLMQMKNK